MPDKPTLEDVILYEIRENRKEIKGNRSEIQKLKMQVFSNKLKLGIFVTGITIAGNILFIFIKDKLIAYLNT